MIVLIYAIGIYILYLHRNTKTILLVDLIILLFNHSIMYGEYITKSIERNVGGLYNSDFGNIYDLGIVFLLIQELIRLFFSYINRNKKYEIEFNLKESTVTYFVLFFTLLYIAIFKIDRSPMDGYSVRISPMYEYSYILFIFLLCFQKKTLLFNILSYSIALLIIAQDMIWGGRITSMQIGLVFLLINHQKYISLKRIVPYLTLAIILFSVIGSFRNVSFSEVNVLSVIRHLVESGGAIDTAFYAYWATMTQIYAALHLSIETSLQSFYSFFLRIFSNDQVVLALGGDPKLANVTRYSANYHVNVGGGLSLGYYFFFLRYVGVFLLTALQYHLLYGRKYKTILSRITLICLIAACGRWYLYSPMAFYRGPFVFLPIVYLMVRISSKIKFK